jgi:hypothetical protein
MMYAVRSKLRANWRELAWCAAWTPVAVFDHHGGLFLALFCTGTAAVGWLMHWSRGRSTVEQKIDRLTATVGAAIDKTSGPPHLRLATKNGRPA